MSEKPLATMNSHPANVRPFSRVVDEALPVVDGGAAGCRAPVAADLWRRIGDDDDVEERKADEPGRSGPRHGSYDSPGTDSLGHRAVRTYQACWLFQRERLESLLRRRRRLTLRRRGLSLASRPRASEERRNHGQHVQGSHSLRVARPADDRRVGGRGQSVAGHARARDPGGNLLAADLPGRAGAASRDATEAARAALESPLSGPRFSELVASATKVCVIIDNQFRPTPQSKLLPPVFDAIEAAGKPAVVVCANGKVFPMSDSDIEQKIGKDNLARMERLGISFHQNDPRNADDYEYVGVSSRGTPVWLHKEVAACDVKITIGQAQSNHWGRAAAAS